MSEPFNGIRWPSHYGGYVDMADPEPATDEPGNRATAQTINIVFAPVDTEAEYEENE